MKTLHTIIKPYVEQQTESGMWCARYPERDWCATAHTEQEARRMMREEEARRQISIEYAEEMFERELASTDPNVTVTEL